MHLTNNLDLPHIAAVASDEAAGAPVHEIKITPEMLQAGVEAYRPFWMDLRDSDPEGPPAMVASVYREMRLMERSDK